MLSYKVGRGTEEIRKELAVIMRELKDPRVSGLLSIVNLNLTNDFSHCTVFISSLDGLDKAKEAVEGLDSASGFIRRTLGKRLRIRRVPEFHFVADDGIAYSATIGKKINQLKSERKQESDHED